jgi:TBC1 domain family member 15
VDPAIRPEVWKFLLGLYPWDSSGDERKAIRRSKRDEYVRLKAKWWDDLELQEGSWFKDQKSRIGGIHFNRTNV